MARSSSVKKNIKRDLLYKKYADKRSSLLAIAKNQELSFEDRLNAQVKLSELPRNSSKNRFRNR